NGLTQFTQIEISCCFEVSMPFSCSFLWDQCSFALHLGLLLPVGAYAVNVRNRFLPRFKTKIFMAAPYD
ncbi:MAG TPA: hypothetical protein VHT51_17805, partial [Micropepsaceae bacterium]|nr:hypothetical protein [Micropepsaceae bacterium]